MRDSLRAETAKLERSWMRHDSDMLRHYLVSGVEDPRINAQSILSRHFLLQASGGDRLAGAHGSGASLRRSHELAAQSPAHASETEELAAVLHALRRSADNAEGIEIPRFILQSFASLPVEACGLHGPQLHRDLPRTLHADFRQTAGRPGLAQHVSRVMEYSRSSGIWHPQKSLPSSPPPPDSDRACLRFRERLSVPRCLRFDAGVGLYRDGPLREECSQCARTCFPACHFACGNAFALPFPDKSFDFCFVHDLFEHLSLEGMEQAVAEVCRVARAGICVGFFNMHEIAEHRVVPDEDYYWNDLSLVRTRESFAQLGFTGQAIHVGTFLRDRTGCAETHNPNAYTFYLRARRGRLNRGFRLSSKPWGISTASDTSESPCARLPSRRRFLL